jgi:hypothetical protein
MIFARRELIRSLIHHVRRFGTLNRSDDVMNRYSRTKQPWQMSTAHDLPDCTAIRPS